MLLRFFSLILFSTFCVVYSCDRTIPPKKFDSLPKESFWRGGVDGGHWIQINSYNDSIANISVYHDWDGSLMERGDFKICEECNNIKIGFKDLEKEILLFDGMNVVLKKVDSTNHYCYLKEVHKAK